MLLTQFLILISIVIHPIRASVLSLTIKIRRRLLTTMRSSLIQIKPKVEVKEARRVTSAVTRRVRPINPIINSKAIIRQLEM